MCVAPKPGSFAPMTAFPSAAASPSLVMGRGATWKSRSMDSQDGLSSPPPPGLQFQGQCVQRTGRNFPERRHILAMNVMRNTQGRRAENVLKTQCQKGQRWGWRPRGLGERRGARERGRGPRRLPYLPACSAPKSRHGLLGEATPCYGAKK